MSDEKKRSRDRSREIEAVKTYVQRILKEKSLYSKEMTYQVELLASDLIAFRRIRDIALAEETQVVISESSREGDERKKENPVFNMMAKFADRVRKDLRALKMNKELQTPMDLAVGDENDELSQLMAKISEDD